MTVTDGDGLASLDPTTQSLAHNLRTPLTVVIGYLDLLAEGQFGRLTDEQAQVIGVMHQESERLRLMIDRLIALREVEALKMTEDGGRTTTAVCSSVMAPISDPM